MSLLSRDEAQPTGEVDAPRGADVATSVGKALVLLEAFADGPVSLGVTELARRSGLPKSTAFRLLLVLEARNLVERHGVRWSLGRRLFELGNQVSMCRPLHLRDVAQPFLVDLYEHTHETVHLAVLDGSDVLYLEKLHGHDHVAAPSRVGARAPAHCCALGKAMLAHADRELVGDVLARLTPRTRHTIVVPSLMVEELARVRHEGVAFDREEARLGLACVAAPILVRGRPVGAVSVSGPTSRFVPRTIAPSVRRAAEGIGRRLGG